MNQTFHRFHHGTTRQNMPIVLHAVFYSVYRFCLQPPANGKRDSIKTQSYVNHSPLAYGEYL